MAKQLKFGVFIDMLIDVVRIEYIVLANFK